MDKQRQHIEGNIAVHDRIAEQYDARHGEIFNPIEQARLAAALREAKDFVTSESAPPTALDLGCGSGNLTRHLLSLGFAVTAADVSPKFLELVQKRFASEKLSVMQLNGEDLAGLDDGSIDFIATYSVLHHVPDYLGAIAEFGRVVAPGGVVYLDHEQHERYWQGDPILDEFYARAKPYDWKKWFVPSNYVHKIWRLFDPRHANEGDIHVWPDDHIEWDKIAAVLAQSGLEPVMSHDYLLFRGGYDEKAYAAYRARTSDMRCMAFRKRG